jgi:hypothetical protein
MVSSSRSSYSATVSFTPVFWAVITVNSTISPFRCIIVSQNMIAANTNIIEGWYAKKTWIHTNKRERCYLAWCCATGPLSIDQYIYEHTLMATQAGGGTRRYTHYRAAYPLPIQEGGGSIPCRFHRPRHPPSLKHVIVHIKSISILLYESGFCTYTHGCFFFVTIHLFLEIRAHHNRWKDSFLLSFLSESKDGDGNIHTHMCNYKSISLL